jgi:pimeloyl-ACP methyl ester carboxylesterase
VQLKTPTGVLYGTLELPAGKGPWPVALIIAGSGPTDRNGNSPIGLTTDTYKLLASALARRGIATLRYDKRGIGQSAPAGPLESKLRFVTYVDDAVAWGKQLAADSRFSTLTILGHSEGSLIGMLAAPRIPADAFVSISGAGEPAGALLLAQLKPQLPEDIYNKAQHIVAQLEAGKTVADVPPDMTMLFRPSVQPYLISWFRHDPAKAIAKLRMPVLIVQGERDIQVPVAAAKKLASADAAARLVLIPKMNHVLKDVGPSRQDNLAAYQNPKLPIDTILAKSISQFIERVQ